MSGQPIATEFDVTTNALVNGLRRLGVERETIEGDMQFLVSMFYQVTTPRMALRHSDKETTEVLDCALIGLIYHRRMPFQIEDEDGNIGELAVPERAENDYIFTLTTVTNALVRQGVANDSQIMVAAMEGGLLARTHIPDKTKDLDPLIDTLRKHFITLCTIGMIVHRLMPHTSTPPDEQGVYGAD